MLKNLDVRVCINCKEDKYLVVLYKPVGYN